MRAGCPSRESPERRLLLSPSPSCSKTLSPVCTGLVKVWPLEMDGLGSNPGPTTPQLRDFRQITPPLRAQTRNEDAD